MLPGDRTRVGYILKMYPRLSETFIVTEILAHEAAGVDLEIFSLRPPIDGRFHESLARVAAPVNYLPAERVRAEEFWTSLGRARQALPGGEALHEICDGATAADIHQSILLAEMILDRGITHLHAHFGTVATTVARIAARLAGVPYSFTAHAKDIFHESVVEEDLRRKLRDAATVITVSDFNKTFLDRRYGADAASVKRIYNGLDLEEFPYTAPNGREPIVSGIGRLVEKKGFGDLVRAMHLLKQRGRDARCEIVGDGAYRGALEAQIDELDLHDRVSLVGARPRGEVIERIRRAALVAAPCIVGADGNRDGLPTVILEAMSLGTPCVATDVTGIPEVIRDGLTGLGCRQGDPVSLADAIERLLDDGDLSQRLSRNARRLMEEQFDIHLNTAAAREIFTTRPTPRRVVTEVGS
jgi:glycosyltransferase involved in cell wall biosynthesis